MVLHDNQKKKKIDRAPFPDPTILQYYHSHLLTLSLRASLLCKIMTHIHAKKKYVQISVAKIRRGTDSLVLVSTASVIHCHWAIIPENLRLENNGQLVSWTTYILEITIEC